MVVLGMCGCIQEKVVVLGQSGFVREKVVVFGQSGRLRAKVVVIKRSGCIIGQSDCIRENLLYSWKVVEFVQKWL